DSITPTNTLPSRRTRETDRALFPVHGPGVPLEAGVTRSLGILPGQLRPGHVVGTESDCGVWCMACHGGRGDPLQRDNESADGLSCQVLYDPRGITCDDRIWGHIPGDHGPATNDRPGADRHSLENDASCPDPHVVADDDRADTLGGRWLLGPALSGIDGVAVEVTHCHEASQVAMVANAHRLRRGERTLVANERVIPN